MKLSNKKYLIPIIIFIILLGIIIVYQPSNSKLGINLPSINLGAKNNNTSAYNNSSETPSSSPTNTGEEDSTYYNPNNHAGMPNCPNCGSNNVVLTCEEINEDGSYIGYINCLYCGFSWTSSGPN